MTAAAKHWLLLAGLFLGLVLVVGTWVTQDRRPPEWDHANHLERAAVCHQILSEQGWSGLGEILEMSSFYPPVVPCSAALLYSVFPIAPLTSQSVMLAFLGLALVSVFLLGRRLFDAPTGLAAGLFLGTAPFVVYSCTNFQLDLPLASVVSFALLVLVLTEDFSRRSWSVVLGLTLALGMLVKPPFAIYLFPPLALVSWRAWRGADRGTRVGNLALALLGGSALSLPWYGLRVFGLPMQIGNRAFKQAAESGYPGTFTSSSLAFYPRALLPMFGILAGLLFAWGLWALTRQAAVRGLLWSASVVPFALFLLIQNKNLRYVLPLLPVSALIAAAALRALPEAWRRVVTIAVLVVSVVQVGGAAFAVPPSPRWAALHFPLIFSFPPSPVEWPHQRILAVIVGEAGASGATVSVVPNDNYFSVANFRYYAVRDRLPLRMVRAWDESPLGVDFVVLKTGSQGPAFSVAKARRIMERLAAGDPAFERAFPVVWEGPLPDGSVATVRQRRLAPVMGVSPSVLAARFEGGFRRFLEPFARDVEGLELELRYAPPALLGGEIRQVRIAARSARVAEFSRKGAQLRIRDVRLTLEGLVVNPYRLLASGEIELLALERLRVDHLVVTREDLQGFFAGLRGFQGLGFRLEEGAVTVRLSQRGPDVAGRVRVENGRGNQPLQLRAEGLSLGGIPLPRLLVHWVFRQYDPGPRLARLPVAVELAPIRVEPERIVVSRTP